MFARENSYTMKQAEVYFFRVLPHYHQPLHTSWFLENQCVWTNQDYYLNCTGKFSLLKMKHTLFLEKAAILLHRKAFYYILLNYIKIFLLWTFNLLYKKNRETILHLVRLHSKIWENFYILFLNKVFDSMHLIKQCRNTYCQKLNIFYA